MTNAVKVVLRQRAIEGVMWASSQALLSKIIAFAAQLILARLLTPADFGVVAMANSIMFLMSAVQSGGIRSILIRRQKNASLWLNSAFWYATLLGVSTAILVYALSPLLIRYYNQPELSALMPVIVIGLLIDNLAVVPSAVLQSNLHFRTLGLINILAPVLQVGLSISLALHHWGALSLVLPKIPVGLMVALALWRSVTFRPKARLQTRCWRYLISDSGYLLVAWLCFAAAGQVPVAMLARALGAESAGLYAFAMSITTQVIALLTTQLDNVLFPALAKLSSTPDLQWRAFIKASTILAQLVLLVSGLQLLLAAPVIEFLFSEKWRAAIPLVQLFSTSNAILAVAIPTGGAMQARGRIRLYCGFALISLTIASLASGIPYAFGASLSGYVLGAAIYQISISFVAWWIVAGIFSDSILPLLRALKAPFMVTAMALAICLVLARHLTAHGPLLQVFVAGGSYVLLWMLLMFIFFRRAMTDSINQAISIFHAKRHTEIV